MSKLIECPICEKMISPNAKACPKCGEPICCDVGDIENDVVSKPSNNSPINNNWFKYIVIGLIIVTLISSFIYYSSPTEQQRNEATKNFSTSTNTEVNNNTKLIDTFKGTASQKNAVNKAMSYLKNSSFSKKGLIEQLEYEGFNYADATFGVDYLKVDWMEEALKKAKSYLENNSFSKEGLIEQLDYEGFSIEEATYGVGKCGADWTEQAVKKAKSYLENSSFSRSGLIDQLEYEGFSHSQAVFGVNATGL